MFDHIDLTRLGTEIGAADLGRVWGVFWETKILDFRIFFDVFSEHILKRVSEGKQKQKK